MLGRCGFYEFLVHSCNKLPMGRIFHKIDRCFQIVVCIVAISGMKRFLFTGSLSRVWFQFIHTCADFTPPWRIYVTCHMMQQNPLIICWIRHERVQTGVLNQYRTGLVPKPIGYGSGIQLWTELIETVWSRKKNPTEPFGQEKNFDQTVWLGGKNLIKTFSQGKKVERTCGVTLYAASV